MIRFTLVIGLLLFDPFPVLAQWAVAFDAYGAEQLAKQLEFTPQQLKQIREIMQKKYIKMEQRNNENLMEAVGPDGKFDPFRMTPTTFADVFAEADAKLGKLLTKKQKQRLVELDMQRRGVNALLSPAVAEYLNIDPDTHAYLKQLWQDRLKRSVEITTEFNKRQWPRTVQGGVDFEKASAALQARVAADRKATEAEMLRHLTKRQRDLFVKMAGEKYKPDFLTKKTTTSLTEVKTEAASPTPAAPADKK